jgi:hypothetical protein
MMVTSPHVLVSSSLSSQVEGIVYNEREKCFDEFSNLFRRYSDINRSDLDGSKTEEFWPILAQIGTKVTPLPPPFF